ncbi:MAG: hypothetical protein Ta2E_08610 [Mycoplasmoidaceae bacterium]|nr:MAG: hypothetical protein Ta2E_08610 [Mycoplasmoidaceae bacterium]
MKICRFLINYDWKIINANCFHLRSFYPGSARFSTYIICKWLWLVLFIICFISPSLLIVIRLYYFELSLDGFAIAAAISWYVLSFFTLFMFMICICNKYYKMFLKTLQYIGTLNDSKLIANELNKLHDYKILNETQWLIYKFWYIYQKDIPWNNKSIVVNVTRKNFSDKRIYKSEVFELVKDL